MSFLEPWCNFGSPVHREEETDEDCQIIRGHGRTKATISISIAEDGRNGPIRFLGVIPSTADDVAKLVRRLAKHGELDFCYEASGCGYGIHRQLTALGHQCRVVAPSMIPRKPGERIKTDRRDSEKLAILHRSGDLTPAWLPDTTHEALRDLVRARVDASMHLMRARQQLLAFLLRHGRSYPTGKHWTQRHRGWLAGQTFKEHAHGIVFQDYLETVCDRSGGEVQQPLGCRRLGVNGYFANFSISQP
jgi:hypothetical protein